MRKAADIRGITADELGRSNALCMSPETHLPLKSTSPVCVFPTNISCPLVVATIMFRRVCIAKEQCRARPVLDAWLELPRHEIL
jgi:hypothetical protein